MPIFPIIAGSSPGWMQTSATTKYWASIGNADYNAAEAPAQMRARDSYTWADFAIRVPRNERNAITTVKSRVGGADGNMSVSVGAITTGLFEDAVNSDALVSGSLFDIIVQAPLGVGVIYFSGFGGTLTTAINITPIINVGDPPANVGYDAGNTYYFPILGIIRQAAAEAWVQYVSRTSLTMSRLHTYIDVNTLDVICTIRPRFNGGDGNLVCSIGAGTSGLFEDAGNNDAVVPTDLVNHILTIPAGNGKIYPTFISFQTNGGQWIGAGYGTPGASLAFNVTTYQVIQGNSNVFNTTEAQVEMPVHAVGTARNMMLRTNTNDLDDATTVRDRINAGNGNLSVSIPSATTGTFEDVANSDDIIITDSWDWQFDTTASSAGSIRFSIVGLQFDQPAGGGDGLENKSANMGSKMVGAGII